MIKRLWKILNGDTRTERLFKKALIRDEMRVLVCAFEKTMKSLNCCGINAARAGLNLRRVMLNLRRDQIMADVLQNAFVYKEDKT